MLKEEAGTGPVVMSGLIDISAIKENINLVEIVRGAGVDLQKRGTRHVGRCPFHEEKTASFYVFPDNRFKCFGCGFSGDSIDFLQKLHGYSFKEALSILGIKPGPITPQVRKEIEAKKYPANSSLKCDI